MDVFETVSTMLAVRSFQDKPIPETVLRKIVEAGRLTASARNRQPWSFIVIEDREHLRQLGSVAKTGPYIAEAAAAIVVTLDETKTAVSDGARAIQSMLLTAWSEGVGGNWVGPSGADDIRAMLGIPAERILLATIALGYPSHEIGKGEKDRKPLAGIAFRERYGEPFS
mgnify:CR=1 FL=1